MKKYWISFLFLFILFSKGHAEEHPVIYVVSSFRSLSTAFLKMMHYRGDFKVINEPSHRISVRRSFPEITIERPDCYNSLQEMPQVLANYQEKSPVFVKDVVAHFYDLLDEYPPSVFSNPDFKWVILARDPADILLSFYRAMKKYPFLYELYKDPSRLGTRVGMRELYTIFERFSHLCIQPPKILFTSQIASDPSQAVQTFCKTYNLPFSEEHLKWKKGESYFLNLPEKMGDSKDPKWIDAFFSATIKSTHFGKMRTCKRDEWGEPTFEEVEELELRSVFKAIYQEHIVYYRKLLDAKEFHLLQE